MSLDPSLKTKGALARHRNVLTRAERVEILQDEEKWEQGDPLLGLPKVSNRKASIGKKDAKKEAAEGEAGAEGETTTETAAQ